MNNMSRRIIYLAGPVSDWNEKQRTEWRSAIKGKLTKLGHNTKDPTAHGKNWTPLIEMVEIDECDAVIANLWRVSIGTVIGIMQASRKGKPIILIDQNYLATSLLERLVGTDRIVRGVDEAVNLLQNQVLPQLKKEVSVRTRDGSIEPFSFSKLHDSLNAVCAGAHVSDAVLPELVANEVHRAVTGTERDGVISSEQIKRLVFEQLTGIMKDNDQPVSKLRKGWENYEKGKKDQRWALQRIEELGEELKLSAYQVQSLQLENASLREHSDRQRHSVRQYEQMNREDVGHEQSRTSMIERVLGSKAGLCVCRIGKGSFSGVFERQGVCEDDFRRLFEERRLEGKQSNLNSDLKGWLKSYSYVLYAWDGLRHLSDPKLHIASSLISASGAKDVVQKFMAVVDSSPSRSPHALGDLSPTRLNGDDHL